jgi:hypothetical protein
MAASAKITLPCVPVAFVGAAASEARADTGVSVATLSASGMVSVAAVAAVARCDAGKGAMIR